mgnify:CR=1 FL=1
MQYDFLFAYLRLSRDDKEKMEESNSIKNQRLLIQHFVEKQPEFAGAKHFFFVDDGYSGTTFDRPEFKRMIADHQEKTDLYYCQRFEPPGKGYHRNTKLY